MAWYEAVVYSNVEAPTEGKKFGSTAAVTPTGDFQYQLVNGELTATNADATNAFLPARVGGTSFDHTAGSKAFDVGAREAIPGSYHGVSGNYYCTPAANNVCAAQVATSGFTLGGRATAAPNTFSAGASGGTWVFVPGNANARVMSAPDPAYASYGWWIHKAANDGPFTASAFVDDFKGTVANGPPVCDTLVAGTATYIGGAAGKYALASSTGGTNDAGHFTARATLEAELQRNNTAPTSAIIGTIDRFMGADGMARPDWSVKLNGSDSRRAEGGIGNFWRRH